MPGTSEISLPSLSSSRVCGGSIIVGTCAIRPAPTTSPMSAPSLRREDRVLDVAVEVEGPGTALAADPGATAPAERGGQVADEEAVDPHRAGADLRRNALGAVVVTGHDGGGQPVVGVVGHRDALGHGVEALEGEHRAEHLLAGDLHRSVDALEHRRKVVAA